MEVPHPDELAIVRPDGEFFLIAERSWVHSTGKAIPGDIFRNIVAFKISPKTFVAHRERVGTPDYELVFSKVGIYKVLLVDPLFADIEIKTRICEVTLTK